MTKRILVTGAGGFVGPYLIRALQKADDNEIFAAVYQATSDLADLLPADRIISGDLTDYAYTANLVKTALPDVVYHLAAISTVHNSPEQSGRVLSGNTLLQYNVLEAVRQFAPRARVLAVCSANEYGLVDKENIPITEDCPLRPLNPYAVSKVAQDMLAEEYYLAYGLDIVIVRPFNHTGPGQTTGFVVPALAKQFAAIEKGASQAIDAGNLTTVRDFTDVSDMVAAYLLGTERGVKGERYNIGTGHGISVREILDIFESLTGKTVEIKTKAEVVREADVPVLIADASKFVQCTGWTPHVPIRDTIMNVLEYWRTK